VDQQAWVPQYLGCGAYAVSGAYAEGVMWVSERPPTLSWGRVYILISLLQNIHFINTRSGFLTALEFTKFIFGRRSGPDAAEGAYRPFSWFKMDPTSKGMGREGRKVATLPSSIPDECVCTRNKRLKLCINFSSSTFAWQQIIQFYFVVIHRTIVDSAAWNSGFDSVFSHRGGRGRGGTEWMKRKTGRSYTVDRGETSQ